MKNGTTAYKTSLTHYLQMRRSIQEWTKWNLCKTAFKISNLLKVVFHKFHLVHSWILCLIYSVIFVSLLGYLHNCIMYPKILQDLATNVECGICDVLTLKRYKCGQCIVYLVYNEYHIICCKLLHLILNSNDQALI